MSHFQRRLEKTADDGSRIVLCLDSHHAWFIERPADRDAGVTPLGGFRSEEAARRWADRSFPGGEWGQVDARPAE